MYREILLIWHAGCGGGLQYIGHWKKKGGGSDERSEFTVKQNTQMSD